MEKDTIKKYISKNIITINASERFKNIAGLMIEKKVSCLIVIEKEIPIGIITERDILRTVFYKKIIDKIRARDIMSSPILSIKIDDSIPEVIKFMEENKIRRAIVIGQNNLVCGLVTQTDLLQASATELIQYNLHLERLVNDRTKKLKRLTLIDELTKINNRRYFNMKLTEHVNLALNYNHPLSCMMLDIDFFKKINDKYGHLCGDKILIFLARILNNSIHHTDICCRWGGEEFVILMPFTKLNFAIKNAERLRKKIEENVFKYLHNRIKVTVSFGVSAIGNGIKNEQELLNMVDIGLYKAKKEGRNQVQVGK